MKNLAITALTGAFLLSIASGSYAEDEKKTVFNGTSAGTKITNTARATYEGGNSVSATSEVIVQEVIDVAVSVPNKDIAVDAGASGEQLSYSIQNTGNGTEDYKISYVTSGDFTPDSIQMFVDKNGNNRFDQGEQLVTGGTITLAKDEVATVIIQADIPAGLAQDAKSDFILTATSNTPGAENADEGDILEDVGTGGATDAIVGDSATSAPQTATFIVGKTVSAVTITKEIATQLDPFGNTTIIPGTLITYAITVSVDTTKGPVNNLVITDELPPHLIYKSGSLVLDNAGQTDAKDAADNSDVTANVMTVDLGNVTSSKTYVINLTTEVK